MGSIARVLVIDDDEDDFILASRLLERTGEPAYAAEWAQTFEAGLARLRETPFDACLVDYRLGAMNGVSLIGDARALGVQVPFILLTGDASPEVDRAGMEAGAADYLQKSALTATALERSVRYAMQQRRLEVQRIALAVEQAARAEAERANQMKDEFLAVLGHELRNPLAAMTNAIGLIDLAGGDARSTELAQNVLRRQARVMKRLIDDLLDVARMAHGKLKVQREPVDLVDALRNAIAVVQPVAAERDQNCVIDLTTEHLPMLADATRLEQVFVNLFQNASKYTPPGGQIAVSLARRGDWAVVVVADTGIGMTPDMLARAFDLFVQQKDTSVEQSGLGLGLALVQRIVELHNGEVSASSLGPGQGSTFTVRLPIAVAAATPVTTAERSE